MEDLEKNGKPPMDMDQNLRAELLALVAALQRREPSEANAERLIALRSMIGDLCSTQGACESTVHAGHPVPAVLAG